MKNLLIIFIFLAGFVAVSTAEASSFILKPNVTIQAGKTFTLPVVIDPAGIPQYTVRLSIAFSPDLLEVTSFSFGQNWFTLSQPGYDSIDNKIGELIKTAGFPKGFSSPATFGTITFRAKKAGESTIIVGSQSFVLDAQNNNTLESRPQVRVISTTTVKEPVGETPPLPETLSIPEAPYIQLPPSSLPVGGNIFDVSTAPEKKGVSPGTVFLVTLLIVAILETIRQVFFTKRRRK